MGSGHYNADDFSNYARTTGLNAKTVTEVINRSQVNQDFLPTKFKNGKRESRDSADNPLSTPIIIGGDVTGSMGRLAGELIKSGINTLMPEIFNRKPVTNPHVLFMAIGDANASDQYPIQATQFEADLRIVQGLEQLYVEGGGGGNNNESYMLAWLVAALMTQHDAWEKRNKKGILFTYGDEGVSAPISAAKLKDLLGLDFQADVTAQDALTMALQTYDCYHLVIQQGSWAVGHLPQLTESWQNLLGERAIPVADYTRLPEIITSILQIRGGADKATVIKSWSDETALVVQRAVGGMTTPSASPKTGLVAL